MKEDVLLFGRTRSSVGIITDPPKAIKGRKCPAIIFLNAGIIHRVGPNRFYVTMARRLAAMGFVVFRFDFSGIGDSQAREDALTFEKSSVSEVQEAISALSEARGMERFILIGLCTGAVAAFNAACSDSRIIGIVMINSQHYNSEWLHSHLKSLKTAKIYRKEFSYWRKISLYSFKSWSKFFTEKAVYRRVKHRLIFLTNFYLISHFNTRRKIQLEVKHILKGLHSLTGRGVRLLLVFSGRGMDAEYLKRIFGDRPHELNSDGKLRVETISQTDPYFCSLQSQECLFRIVQEWTNSMV
jgi:hypothetical protein